MNLFQNFLIWSDDQKIEKKDENIEKNPKIVAVICLNLIFFKMTKTTPYKTQIPHQYIRLIRGWEPRKAVLD